MTSTELKTVADKLVALQSIADDPGMAQLVYQKSKADIVVAVELAKTIKQIKALLSNDVMKEVEDLQGTKLGFDTDRSSTGDKYSIAELRQPIVEAICYGYRLANNEFNVIGGNFYAAKNGLERLIRSFPGVQDFSVIAGVPVSNNKTPDVAKVPVVVEYLFHGEQVRKEYKDERAIVVRKNRGMIGAAAVGKAERKAMLMTWKDLGHRAQYLEEE